MKYKLFLSSILTLFSFSANADLLSLEVGTGQWDHKASGQFQYVVGGAGDNLNLESDLGLQDEEEGYTYAIFRHAVPLIPNIKIMTTSLMHEGNNATPTFFFGGVDYSGAGAVNTKMVLDHTDITAFWNLLDTGFTFDLGLTARQVDGEVSVDNGVIKTSSLVDGTIPMLYAGISISPIDSLRLSFEANYLGSGDTAITDTIAKITYVTAFNLGIEAGVRDMSIELDDQDGNFSNMDFSGTFVGLSFKF